MVHCATSLQGRPVLGSSPMSSILARITGVVTALELGLPSMGQEGPDLRLEGLWVVPFQKQGYRWSGLPGFLLVACLSIRG